MMDRKTIGWTALIMLSLAPVFLWYILGPFPSYKIDYWNTTHALGQVTGLIGMTMFALTIILSTRFSFLEDLFGGLDKVYIVHKRMGISSMVFILFHPFFLMIKYIPEDIDIISNYMFPSRYISVNIGIFALSLMLVLIILTFIRRIRYHIWKFSHEFMSLAFILAVFHIFMIRDIASDHIFKGYPIYAGIISAVGISGILYSQIIRRFIQDKHIYRIEWIRSHGKEVHEIILSPIKNPINYSGGQFVLLSFQNSIVGREPHPFSIASSGSDNLKVAVKSLGDFTMKIPSLKSGDTVYVEGPYGRFPRCKKDHPHQVWIAGGIGITPFLGMAEDFVLGRCKGKRSLFYSVRESEDLIALERLQEIERKVEGFRLFVWISKAEGHLTAKRIRKEIGSLKKKEFYICGPEGFKKYIRQGLKDEGVARNRIYEENFRFR